MDVYHVTKGAYMVYQWQHIKKTWRLGDRFVGI